MKRLTSSFSSSRLRRLPRHTGMGRVIAICGLLGLIGCQKVAPPAVSTEGGHESEPKVVVLSCDEYFNPDVVTEFTRRTGIEVEVKTYESTEEMAEKLKSNPQNYDVLVAEQGAVVQMRLGRLLTAIDEKMLPHRNNLDPRYLNQPFDPGNKFSIPYMWGTTALAYRKDHFATPPDTSVRLLFDPSLVGKISLLNERNECYAMVLRKLGVSLDSIETQQMLQATDTLLELTRNQHARFGSDNEVKEHLISGKSSVAMIYSGDAAIIAQDHPEIAYFIPEEGAVMWIDSFAIPRDATHVRHAHEFIDYMIEAETAAKGSNFLRYASPNKAAEPFIDLNLLADVTIYPPDEIRAKCFSMPIWSKDHLRIMNNGWRLAQEGVTETAAAEASDEPPAPSVPTPPETIGQNPVDAGDP